jgi:hypothetical protein
MALLEFYPQTDISNDFWTPSILGQPLSPMLNQAANEPVSPLRYIVCGDSTSASGIFSLGNSPALKLTHAPSQVRIGIRAQTGASGGIARQLTFYIIDPNGVEILTSVPWTVAFPWTRVYAPVTNPDIINITDWTNYRIRAGTGSSTTGKKSDRREIWLDALWIEVTTNENLPLGAAPLDGNFFSFF